MITTIDKAGRVVIPKAVREAMGLEPGTPVDVTFSHGQIVIEYAPAEVSVRDAGGFPVIHLESDAAAPTLTDELVRDTLEAVRGEQQGRHV